MSDWRIINADVLAGLAELESGSVDSIITDPPYGLRFMGKRWDYDVPGVAVFEEILRVAKPGAFLLCFGGTRTYHRMACNIEDAGWEIRDCVLWLYGSGFPKSLDISKALDKAAGAENVVGTIPDRWTGKGNSLNFATDRPQAQCKVTAPVTPAAQRWHGWGTALKPAFEPVIVAMKPCEGTFAQNAEKHGVAGLWIDGGRVEIKDGDGKNFRIERGQNNGGNWGTQGAKPKPRISEMNALGRWPANVIHDGSAEVVAGFPEARSTGHYPSDAVGTGNGVTYLPIKQQGPLYADSGSAARFFYTAKASRKERGPDNRHPTVKPLALMQYLCRLTKTPMGGLVLDPFMGSGTTGVAAIREGRRFVGIELSAEYAAMARRRIENDAPLFNHEETSHADPDS